MTDKKIVFSTCATDGDAERIARALLERRLAACVNIVSGVRSLYRWKGRIEEDRELLLVIKTTAAAIEPLKAAIREVHPYEVPEIVVLPIEDGSVPYLDWIADSVPVAQRG